jgi:hypothetical protein
MRKKGFRFLNRPIPLFRSPNDRGISISEYKGVKLVACQGPKAQEWESRATFREDRHAFIHFQTVRLVRVQPKACGSQGDSFSTLPHASLLY